MVLATVRESEESMILADKIIDLRKKNGWSQEELAEKLEVSRQSVSKWESAQSAPDMKRILMMSELFGVSTDYLLKDNIEVPSGGVEADTTGPAEEQLPEKRVSMQDANGFLDYRNSKSNRIGIGVLLCILSPVPLMLLAEAGAGARIGLLAIFIMVAAAVILFVLDRLADGPFMDYVTSVLDTEYDVTGLVKERREKYRRTHTYLLAGGIALCVAAVIPLILFSTPIEDGEGFSLKNTYPLAAVLILVGLGVFCIVKTNIIWGSYTILLEEGEFSKEAKAEAHNNRLISSIYWTAATVIYLLWSFVTFDWGTTWIVWPIAGVAYGLLEAILRVVHKRG